MKQCSRCHELQEVTEFYPKMGQCKSCLRHLNREWHKENPARSMVRSAKKRATNSGVPFDLTISDIIIPKFCPVLGIPLVVAAHNNAPTANSPSIDRIKPHLGYVKDNILVVSLKANQIKSNATPEEIMKVAEFYGAVGQVG